MSTSNDQAPAVRSIHLQGGCRANDVGGKLEFELPASNGGTAQLSLQSFYHAYGVLRHLGFLIVGADFYFDVEQADGRQLPNWRSHHILGKPGWPCAEQSDGWSFIAHSAFRQKNGQLWDVASRIRHQLRVCDWRLRQVSECYRDQLHAKVRRNEFQHGRRFHDGFTWLGYLALQAFLVDACVLRDYLAECRALILTQSGEKQFRGKITRIASLKSQFLSKEKLTKAVDQEMQGASEPGGWLYLLGSYRDLVVHYAPLASAGRSLYAVCEAVPIEGQTTLPSIKFPIPPDPEKIASKRVSGAHFDDPELNYARFLNALEDPASAHDGLQYAHATLGKLASLAQSLAAVSPVAGEMPVLTDADVLDVKIIQRGPGEK